MTSDDQFGRSLSAWLHDEAGHRVPDHLADVLVQTVATRQRPWWSSLERLLPMTTTARTRVTLSRPLLLFAIAALVLLALGGLALLAGALRAPTVPLGPASNGRIVVADGSSMVTYAPDGTDRRDLIANGSPTTAHSISPDGTRVAFKLGVGPPRIRIVGLSGGQATDYPVTGAIELADEPLGWSPDGKKIAFAGLAPGREELYVLDVDARTIATPLGDALDPDLGVWLPSFSPDGQWILFATPNPITSAGELNVVHADGTGLRGLGVSASVGDGGGPIWSPRHDAHQIAYLTFANGGLQTRLFDLDADQDYLVGQGFWPSWSPDGSRLAVCCALIYDTGAVLAGTAEPVPLFEQPDGNCPDLHAYTGRVICSALVWSPDGTWVAAADVAGRDLLLSPADGSRPPTRVTLAAGRQLEGFHPPITWQALWP